MRQLPSPAAVWSLLSATPHSPAGILLQVDHALQLHTTDNVSVITVCFRDTPPPSRMQREVPPSFLQKLTRATPLSQPAVGSSPCTMRCCCWVAAAVQGARQAGAMCSPITSTSVLRKALSHCLLQGRPAAAMGRTLSREGLSLLNDALLPSSCLPHIPEQRPAQTAAVSGL